MGVWIVALLVGAALASQQTKHLTGGGFNDPASQSAAVQRELAKFPQAGSATLALVLVPRHDAGPTDLRHAIARTVRAARGQADVRVDVASYRAALQGAAARPAQPVVIALRITRGGDDRGTDVAQHLRTTFDLTNAHPGHVQGARVDVHLAGQGALWAAVQRDSQESVKVAEIRALPLIAIVLLGAFGSLAATLLPLTLGGAAVILSGALVFLLSLVTQTSVFVTNVVTMLGLGVAVDYSLFILVRYREEIAGGAPPQRAIASALSTSGVAVAFSGITVIAALAGMFFIDSTALRSIAAGAMLVVLAAVVAACTLLPVLIGVLGRRAHELGRLASARERRAQATGTGFWARWSAVVMRRPVVSVTAAAALMLTLAIPALDMHVENAGLRQVSDHDPFRAGAQSAAAIAGKGALGPAQIVVRATGARTAVGAQPVARVRAVVARDPAVRQVSPPQLSRDRSAALLAVVLRVDPTSEAARSAVVRLRANLPAAAGAAATVRVGGTTAAVRDFDHLVNSSLWKIALFVCALSFVVLVPLLRSIVLPLKAVVLTMLSVLAAYGVIVAVFQWGWLSFLGLSDAPYVDTITPPLVLVIAFGLSMDYEVFMLSRIRERYEATGDTRRAVAEALTSTGRTITSAALIMVLVFLAFVSAGLPTIQRLGVGLATAVALDATVVRLILVPAAMVLLDKWNWWLPRPLSRLQRVPAPTLGATPELSREALPR